MSLVIAISVDSDIFPHARLQAEPTAGHAAGEELSSVQESPTSGTDVLVLGTCPPGDVRIPEILPLVTVTVTASTSYHFWGRTRFKDCFYI